MPSEAINKLRQLVTEAVGKDCYVDPRQKKETLSTGIKSVDLLLGGGVKEGTWMELFGVPGSGKSYLAQKMIVEAQRKWPEKACVYLDFEKVWDPERAEALGIDLDNMIVLTPATQEEGYQLLQNLVKTNEVSVLVVDSVAAMVPDYEAENDMGQKAVGQQASVNSKGLRKVTPGLKDSIIVLINQLREAVGVVYGNPEKTSGGRALLHWASHRIKISKNKLTDREEELAYDAESGSMKKAKVERGFKMKFFVEKTRGGREHSSTELIYDYETKDIPYSEDVKNVLATKELISKTGAFFTVEGVEKKIHGMKALDRWIEANPEHVDELMKKALSS